MSISEILDRAASGAALQRTELIALLHARDGDEAEALYRAADAVREEVVGSTVHLRGIIEIANECACACLYCGLRAQSGVARYRMSPDEILARASEVAALPVRTIVLQSGEADSYTARDIADVVRVLSHELGVAVTLSLGVKDEATYRMWRDAGADRYLLKHETANPELFRRMKPGVSMEARIEALRILGALGYQVGTGNMVGLPGQTVGDLADDILLCRSLGAGMTTFGPFVPSPLTPLSSAVTGSPAMALRVIATARLALRTVHLPANTALGTLAPDMQRRAFSAGANVFMPNFTPLKYKEHYHIYPKPRPETEDARLIHQRALALLASVGRTADGGFGHARWEDMSRTSPTETLS